MTGGRLMARLLRSTALRSMAAGALVAITALSCTGDDDPTATTTTVATAPETTTTTEPPVEAGTQVYVYTPEPGDCFDRRRLDAETAGPGGQTEIVLLLDCSLPHQNQVFAVVDYPNAGEPFPGEEALEAFGKRECPQYFQGYVGLAYEVSELEIGFQFPTESSWAAGSQRVGCYLFDGLGAKLMGSMQGAAR
jgi:hypothetical protein